MVVRMWCSTILSTLLPIALALSNPKVTIKNGTAVGTLTSHPSSQLSVKKFLGIPFAKSPPLRFGIPEPANAWQGELNATSWKASCIQQFSYPAAKSSAERLIFDSPTQVESEDCLHVNIYAPANSTSSSKKPVLFWLYGGSYQFGSATQRLYDGSAIAGYEDMVVVTSNYRSNVFGFPFAPELALNEQNLGFLDAFKALDWTRENIAAFGGDPAKITIFGQSSGAAIVDRMILMNPQNPPFRAAILQSFQSIYQTLPHVQNHDAWLNMTSSLGCNDSKSNLTCMRAAKIADMQKVMNENSLPFGFTTLAYDNVTNPSDPLLRKQSGGYAKVPVLVGTVADEGTLFSLGQNTSSAVDAYLSGTESPPQVSFSPAEISQISTSLTSTGIRTPFDQLSHLQTLLHFQCPMALWANQSCRSHTPTWRYFYNATFPNTQPGLQKFHQPSLNAWHTSEIAMIFQTYPGGPVNLLTANASGLMPTNVAATEGEVRMGQKMQKAWARFARDPGSGPGWKELGEERNMALFVDSLEENIQMVDSRGVDQMCDMFKGAFEKGTIGFDQAIGGGDRANGGLRRNGASWGVVCGAVFWGSLSFVL